MARCGLPQYGRAMRHAAAVRTITPDDAPSVISDTLQHVSATALEATVMMSSDGRISGWNARAEELFGWNAAEVVGRPLADVIIPARFRRRHRAGLARYRLTGKGRVLDRPLDLSALYRDGTEFPIQLAITALGEGSATVFVGFVKDVSAQQAMETALRDTEARYRSLVEHLPGIAYVDEIGGVGRYVSPQVESILGYTVAEWLSDPDLWSRILHDEDRERALAQLVAGEAAGGSFTYLYRLIARDGRTIWIRDQASVLREENGGVAVHGVMFDVTREVGMQADLELELAERQRISEALRRLPAGRPAQETAAAICRELVHLPHVDMAMVYEFAHDGSVIPLGQIIPSDGPTRVGQALPPDRAAYLRESATGPWIDEWRPQANDTQYERAWHRLGLKVAAYVPFGTSETTHGLLGVGSTHPIGSAEAARWMPSVAEIGAVAAALLMPELGSRRAQDTTRSQLARIIANGEFHPVFQPIVRLGDGTVVGYEALTRFADGVSPERWFALAEAVEMGAELEAATARAALEAAAELPARAFISVNVSPSRLADPRLLRLVSGAKRRPVVLEITERLAIEDYAAARDALDQLTGSVDVAVDDAGAGFASLRHIIELRPRYVKLDLQLVRGVEGDPARQALIAGMVYFARDTGCLLIAEGVEKAAERDTLRRLGVPFGQGFLFGRPALANTWKVEAEPLAKPTTRRKAAEPTD
jgi:PAS domain S-box-containing protein